ncbi:MAG: hypothetical protein E7560_06435 [Ruminococcaceae bacterium]|nr:hypothetical protein [Oscillospiraceae bacterium]
MTENYLCKKSDLYRVFVGERELDVFKEATCDFVLIRTESFVDLKIFTTNEIETIDIRPTRRKKEFNIIDKNSLSVKVNCGEYLSLEVNSDLERPLLIFADEPKTVSAFDGYNLMYFEKDTFYETGIITPQSNTVIFIDEGAVVDGAIFAQEVENVRVLGNGIIKRVDDSKYRKYPVCFEKSKNIEVSGITIIGKHNWNLRMLFCENFVIENVKILAHEIWSDGIDMISCKNALVRHVFVKNEDDCICIKSYGEDAAELGNPDVYNILVEDCVLWSGPRGNSLEIGYETNLSTISNVSYRNIDVIHRQTQENKFHRAVISIHNAGSSVVKNITYENIFAEHSDENLFYIAHMYHPSWGTGGGVIENIAIRNFSLTGGEIPPSILNAYPKDDDLKCVINNLCFENLVIHGEKVTENNFEQMNFQVKGVENLKFL